MGIENMSEDLKQQLAGQRAATAVRNDHTIRAESMAADLRQLRRDAAFDRERRESARAGQRAALRARLMRSPERKAAALAQMNVIAMWALVVAMVAFAAWSTAGVQAGLVRMMHLNLGTAPWWGAWFAEPALITVVAVIILVKARLREAGAHEPQAMNLIEGAALFISLALNVFGAGEGEDVWAMVGHSMGPIGCAMVAFLMGVVSAAIIDAISSLPISAQEPDPMPTPEIVSLPEPIVAEIVIEHQEPERSEVVEEVTETVTRTARRTTRGRTAITDEERATAETLIRTRPELSMTAVAGEVWGAGTHANKIRRDDELALLWSEVRNGR